jgi:hypothetical protein
MKCLLIKIGRIGSESKRGTAPIECFLWRRLRLRDEVSLKTDNGFNSLLFLCGKRLVKKLHDEIGRHEENWTEAEPFRIESRNLRIEGEPFDRVEVFGSS